MTNRPNSDEREVLDVIIASENGEMQSYKVCEQLRGVRNSARVINLLDSLYQKGWLWKRWPNWYMLNPSKVEAKQPEGAEDVKV